MLSCNGRNVGAFRTGEIRPDCTFLKSDGVPMTGRRAGLFLNTVKLSWLKGLEDEDGRRVRDVEVCDVEGR